MKSDIHPKIYPDVTVTCACGNTFTTISTVDKIEVDICSQCHPFFTGEMKFVDTQGRVEKFQAKMEEAKKLIKQRQAKQQVKQVIEKEREQPKTLKEMLQTVTKPQQPSSPKPASKSTSKQ